MKTGLIVSVIIGLMMFSVSSVYAGTDTDMNAPDKSGEDVSKYTGEMIFVKGGCYEMGCGSWSGKCASDEKPLHEVCVDDFYIGKYEVTQKQWKELMGKNPSRFKNCGDNCPVEGITWDEAWKFIKKLNRKTGIKFRLPTEAEWEYACRSGGKREKFSGGNSVGDVAWYNANAGRKTHPVGQKKPNGLGIYDMSGNVLEWVEDIYNSKAYRKHSRNNPMYKASVFGCRVRRGGSWINRAENMRCSKRSDFSPALSGPDLGFRLLRSK